MIYPYEEENCTTRSKETKQCRRPTDVGAEKLENENGERNDIEGITERGKNTSKDKAGNYRNNRNAKMEAKHYDEG